jgi:hypothetical protein
MKRLAQHFSVFAALAGALAVQFPGSAHTVNAAHPPDITVRRLTTLDARGHVAHVFRPNSKITLRIQWTVRYAPRSARQVTDWTVLYAGRQVFHVTRDSSAKNGNWVRIVSATVKSRPNAGVHTFRGRITVAGVTAERSIVYTVRP